MIALYIILGIIAFFVIVLSVRFKIHVEYRDEAVVNLQWLFLTIPILPRHEKEKKPKKAKEEKPKEEKQEEAKEEEPKKSGGSSPIKQVLKDEGVAGIFDILHRFLILTDKFGDRFARSFVFHTVMLDMKVTADDAAQTAIEYGKWCRRIFPVFGAICSLCKVGEYAVNVYPDYIGRYGTDAELELTVGVIPRKIINSLVMYGVGVVNYIGIRLVKDLIRAIRHPSEPAPPADETGHDIKKVQNLDKKPKEKKNKQPEPEPEPEITWEGRVL